MLAAAVIAIASLATSGGIAPVDPLHQGHIAGESTTVVHIDFSHAAGTELGRHLLDHMGDSEDADFLDKFTTDLGIDLGTDVRAMTIYTGAASVGADAQDGNVSIHAGGDEGTVVLLYGSDALEKWDEALAEEQEGESAGMIDGRPVRAFEEGEGHWLGIMLPDEDGRLWVMASGMEALESAVGVIDGRGERADLDEWPVAGPAEGAFLYVAVRDLRELEEWEPASDVAQRAEGFSLSAGQHEEEGFVRVQITVDNAEDAEAIVGVCQGVIGMGRLVLSDEEDMRPLLKLLGKIQLSADERLIEASLVGEAEWLCDTLDELEELDDLDEPGDMDAEDEEDEEDRAGEGEDRERDRV